MKKETTGIKK